jgi:hypothetical protein
MSRVVLWDGGRRYSIPLCIHHYIKRIADENHRLSP